MIEGGDYRRFQAAPANAKVAWAYFCREISNFAGDWAMYDYWLAREPGAEISRAARAQAALMGKLSWGLLYGLGFGAGIGWVFSRARVGA